MLIRQFSMSEIKEGVWSCGGDKAPGPDGQNFHFIKKFWDILALDFKELMDYFHSSCIINNGVNSSFLALVPKIKDPQTIEDYRPICLIWCIYKAISKILANRTKDVIGSVTDDSQSAFVQGRSILDGPLVMNEILAWLKKSRGEAFIFKVDFKKAFYSVSRSFLDNIMAQ